MMPSGWSEISLGDVLVEHREKTTSNNQYDVMTSSRQGLILQSEYYDGDNRITNRDNTGFNVIPPDYFTYRSRSDDGSFFFNRNRLGKTGCISTYYPVFRFKDSSDEFFYYLLNKNNKIYEPYSVGTSQKVLSLNALKEIKFVVPPKNEQEKIAKILSTWDEAIALAEKYLALISQLTPSLVRDLFKDCEEFAQLKDVSTVISKGTTPTTYGHNYTDSGVNFLRVENITEIGTIDLKDVKYISEETHQFLQRSILKVGDVLFSIAGAIGRTAVVRESSLPANTNQAVAFIRPDLTSVKSDYLRLALHLYAEGGSIEKLQAGNAQKNFNLEQVGNIKIPISSIEKQMEIIKNAEDIYTHIRVLNNYIHALKLQKQGLMQQLLTGKKRVKV